MNRPVRAAVAGAGFMGGVHAAAVRAIGGVVVGVVDDHAERARALQQRCGAEFATTAWTDVLERDDVDVVHVCTPNSSHVQLVEEAIRSGKHVLCEKPLATTVREALQLERLAEKAGVVAAVSFVYRYYPMVRELRTRAQRGDAGAIAVIHGSYLQDWLAAPTDTDWRVDPTAGGPSRAFGDIGVHWIDLIEFASGHRIVRLNARLQRAFPERLGPDGAFAVQTEDAAIVMFETDRSAVGCVVLSQVSHGNKNRIVLSLEGTEAALTFDHDRPDEMKIGSKASTTLLPCAAENLDPAAQRYARLPVGHPHGYQDCFNAYVGDCYGEIQGEVIDGVPRFADGRRAAEVTEAVLESAASSSWVKL